MSNSLYPEKWTVAKDRRGLDGKQKRGQRDPQIEREDGQILSVSIVYIMYRQKSDGRVESQDLGDKVED